MPYQRSVVTVSPLMKMEKLAAAFAIQIARQKGDPLYVKMIKFKRAYKLVKKQLIMKYGAKGKMAARQAALKH